MFVFNEKRVVLKFGEATNTFVDRNESVDTSNQLANRTDLLKKSLEQQKVLDNEDNATVLLKAKLSLALNGLKAPNLTEKQLSEQHNKAVQILYADIYKLNTELGEKFPKFYFKDSVSAAIRSLDSSKPDDIKKIELKVLFALKETLQEDLNKQKEEQRDLE
jgi:hypothetical protein